MSRLAFGLASAREHTEAELHIATCEPCAALYRRLELFHDKVAALTPVPVAAGADPGLVERTLHKTVEVLAHGKQQLAEAGSQAKQHAAAGYGRAVEYTPLASARPGAAATAIAGCLALGGGAAGYCIDKGVDPVTTLVDAVQATPAKPAQEPPERKPPAEQPPDPPQVPAAAPTPTTPELAAPPTQQRADPLSAPPQPAAPPPPPPEPTPPAVQFGEPATPASPSAATPAPAPPPPQQTPAPSSGGTDLYGP